MTEYVIDAIQRGEALKMTKREKSNLNRIVDVKMALFVGISKPDYGLTIAHVSRLCELNWATARDYLNILVSLGVAKKVGMLYQIMRDKDDECDACIFMLNSSLQIKEVI